MKRYYYILSALLFIPGLSLFWQCNRTSTLTSGPVKIDPPFESFTVPGENMKVDPSQANELKTKEGTCVHIPGNAFVFGDGQPVSDSVEISIEEYRTAAEILASGIPMKCDSAGQTYNFESAGMFEISGNSGGREVFLAEGKSIDVDFVSIASGGYDFYFFDDETGQWQNTNAAVAETKDDIVKDKEEAEMSDTVSRKDEKIVKPNRIDEKKSIIDFDITLKNFPELNVYSGIVWQYSGNSKFKDPDSNKWIFKTKWKTYELLATEDETEYILKLTSKDRSFVTSVVPVLNDKDYAEAMVTFRKNLETMNEQMADAKKEVDRQAAEYAVVRSFSINKMGLYNWDRMYKEPNALLLEASFTFDTYTMNDFNDISVFFITDEGRTVVKYPPDYWKKFAFNPEVENKFIAVLPEDKVAYFSAKDFQNLDIDNIRRSGTCNFQLKVSERTISSVTSLDELLNSI